MKSLQKLFEDERAIEGMPIRLVIALVVGMATLAIMMNMLGTLSPPEQTEVDVTLPGNEVVGTDGGPYPVNLGVYDAEGDAVPDATVLVSGGTAQIDGTSVINLDTATQQGDGSCNSGDNNADENHIAFICFNPGGSSPDQVPALRPDQTKGTLKIEVIPPTDSNYVDDRQTTEIVVVDGQA